MRIDSAYVVHTQVIGLGGCPFHLEGRLRPNFSPIFSSRSCFTDFRMSILHADRPSPLPSKPFLRNLGLVCFNTQTNNRLTNSRWFKECLAVFLAGRERYWDPQAKPQSVQDYYDEYSEDQLNFFGYDPDLKDQRMNYLCFELRRPLFLKATIGGQVQADGKVFIHLYPSGYVVLQLAFALKQQHLQSLADLHQCIKETRPWRSDGSWLWSTRLRKGTLPEIVEVIKKNVFQSLHVVPPASIKRRPWQSAMKLAATAQAGEIAARFLKGEYDLLEIGHNADECCPHEGYLLSSRQGLIYVFPPSHSRSSALGFFWKVLTLYEFVLLKNHIYEDYAEFLRTEIANLKEFRLSTLRKLTQEDIRRFSVYDPQIPKYLMALDKHIRSASPFYRRIYSSISNGTGFDVRREKVTKLVKDWEAEVEKWEHKLGLIWKKVISPLRALLGSG